MNNSKIAFIGAGNMATSLIHGLLSRQTPATTIWACDIDQDKLAQLKSDTGVQTGTADQVAPRMDVLVLAVKPQVMKQVCSGLRQLLPADARPLFISIAAGIPLARLEEWLGDSETDRAIVRCMPNTPSLVSEGATALFANPRVSEEQRALAGDILSAVGLVRWLESEGDMDAVTAVSGSGPAYYFLMMEAMEAAAVNLGLDPETARQLTLQTALGAARLAAQSDVSPAELRRRVTSPGGTTEQAIAQFESEGFRESVGRAVAAAHRRSVELARELEGPGKRPD